MNNKPPKLLDLIPYGRENAISMEQLAILLNVDKRTTRSMIFNARARGAVICSECDYGISGYFRPTSPDEAIPYVKMQKSRIKSAKKALRSAEKYIKEGGKNG